MTCILRDGLSLKAFANQVVGRKKKRVCGLIGVPAVLYVAFQMHRKTLARRSKSHGPVLSESSYTFRMHICVPNKPHL